MGRSQRTKGHSFEREIAQRLRPTWPRARRGYQTRGGTAEMCDIEGTPLRIECKVGARPPTPWVALRQAAETRSSDLPFRRPVAVLKQDRQPVVVCMYLDDFLAFIDQERRGVWDGYRDAD